jgi:hypothetical protein
MRLRRGTLLQSIQPIYQDLSQDKQQHQLSVSYLFTICS